MRKLAFTTLLIGMLLWVADARYPIPQIVICTAAVLFLINYRRQTGSSPFATVLWALVMCSMFFLLAWIHQARSRQLPPTEYRGVVTEIVHDGRLDPRAGMTRDTLCLHLVDTPVDTNADVEVIWTDYTGNRTNCVQYGDTIAVPASQLSKAPIRVEVRP